MSDSSTRLPSQPPPLPGKAETGAPQPWYLYIQHSGEAISTEPTKALLAEAVLTSLEHYPASLPIADLEQACAFAERLKELGHDVEVSGYDRTKGEQDGAGQPATRSESE